MSVGEAGRPAGAVGAGGVAGACARTPGAARAVAAKTTWPNRNGRNLRCARAETLIINALLLNWPADPTNFDQTGVGRSPVWRNPPRRDLARAGLCVAAGQLRAGRARSAVPQRLEANALKRDESMQSRGDRPSCGRVGPRACKIVGLCCSWGFNVAIGGAQVRIAPPERARERAVQDGRTDVKEWLYRPPVPAHLLLLDHPR